MEELLKPYIGSSINRNDMNTLEKIKPLISKFTLFKDISYYFPNLENISINNILSSLVIHHYQEDQIIINIGDKINGIYILFTGEISIFKDEQSEPKVKDIKEYEKKFEKRKNIFNSINDINTLPDSMMNPGEAIGYIPKYSELDRSNKTIQATKDTILGYINYRKFNRIIKEMKLQDIAQVLPFMKSLNLFANINNFIEKLRLYTTQKRYEKDSYIFKEGDKFETFYIIKKGVIDISIKIKKTTKSLIQPELLIGKSNKIKITGSKENELKGFYTENVEYNLVKLCQGEILGDIEYYKKYPFYLYSAKCTSQVDLLIINLRKFIQLAKKCGDNLSKYHNKIIQKIEFFKKRIKNINSTIKKIKIDTDKKDIYTKIFIDNNIRKNVEVDEKYINSINSPLGKVVPKYKPFKMVHNICKFVPNYNSIVAISKRCFSAKTSKDKRKKNFLYQSFKKKKNTLNSRNKLLENDFLKKINAHIVKNTKKQSNNLLTKINDFSKNISSKLQSCEIEKINKNFSELSGMDETKRNSFVNLFVENYKKERESRDQTLFNRKLKHNFLIENRRKSVFFKDNSSSLFHLTNPFKSHPFNFNHIY